MSKSEVDIVDPEVDINLPDIDLDLPEIAQELNDADERFHALNSLESSDEELMDGSPKSGTTKWKK